MKTSQYATFDFRLQQNSLALFTFQFWGLALQAMQTPAAYDDGGRREELNLNHSSINMKICVIFVR